MKPAMNEEWLALLDAQEIDESIVARFEAAGAAGRAWLQAVATGGVEGLAPALRGRAAHVLGQLGDPDAAPALAQLLSSQVATVRRNAIHALGELGDAGRTHLVALAKNEKADVIDRSLALRVLPDVAGPELAAQLEPALTGTVAPELRARIEDAIVRLRSRR